MSVPWVVCRAERAMCTTGCVVCSYEWDWLGEGCRVLGTGCEEWPAGRAMRRGITSVSLQYVVSALWCRECGVC